MLSILNAFLQDYFVNKIRMSTLTTSIQPYQRSLDSAIRQEKEINGFQIGMEEVKWSLSTDDIILYVENTKGSTENTVAKIAGYKIKSQKLIRISTH